jgi:hypothetical protein
MEATMSDTFDETTTDETTIEDAPSPLPGDVMRASEGGLGPEDELPLHLRVLRAIVEEQPTQERLDQALALAHEVYDLEVSTEFEE